MGKIMKHRSKMRAAIALFGVAFIAFASVIAGVGMARADESPALFFVQQSASLHPTNIATRTRNKLARVADGGIHALVTESAQRHGVPVRVAHAIVRVESNYNCGARSHMNARGIMQVLPATARGEGVGGNLYNCATGLEAGMRYLRKIVVAHGTSCAALSLYERGIYARPVCTGYGRKAVRLASV